MKKLIARLMGVLRKLKRKIVRPPYCLDSFLLSISAESQILDVGCGNDSSYRIKSLLPNCFYTGIDVMDYNQTKPNLADRYIVVKPEHFAETIAGMTNSFDAVVSSHNLEHCDDRWKTLSAMIQVLKYNGRLYLAFPTEKSVSFPNRTGTLNYYDDPTHKDTPPDYDRVIETLKNANMTIEFASRSYKPFVLRVKGFFDEPLSKKQNKVFYSIWCYYGFEAIIWARKR